MKTYLENRINELIKAEHEFLKDRWDLKLPSIQRMLAREEGEKVCFARQELQNALKQLNGKASDILHCVVADTASAHEAECVYSVWDTQNQALKEIERLVYEKISAGCYNGLFHVVKTEKNKKSNNWISI